MALILFFTVLAIVALGAAFLLTLPTGQIIARAGEMGPRAEILGPGWHFGFYPFTCQVRIDRVISRPSSPV
jgi:hypothetical protein